jgi:hypothetical protein
MFISRFSLSIQILINIHWVLIIFIIGKNLFLKKIKAHKITRTVYIAWRTAMITVQMYVLGIWFLWVSCLVYFSTLKMNAIRSSETSIDFTELCDVTSYKFLFFKTFIIHSFFDEKLDGDFRKRFHGSLPLLYWNFFVIPRIESKVQFWSEYKAISFFKYYFTQNTVRPNFGPLCLIMKTMSSNDIYENV